MDCCNASALTLRKAGDDWLIVEYCGQSVGKVELYSNSFHRQNQYLRLHLLRYEKAWAAPLFALLQHTAAKPLQVMISSQEVEQAHFLLAGGFECRRKCYEMDVTAKDFSPSDPSITLNAAKCGQPAYTICCQFLYEYYKSTHAAMNPLTADFSVFCEQLPTKVYFGMADQHIQHVAFVEENEIAYVASIDIEHFQSFAAAVASKLFTKHESICFECDDCDNAAIALKKLFHSEPEISYDTYIRE